MLNRRSFLAASGLIIGSAGLSIPDTLAQARTSRRAIHAGWIPNRRATAQFKRSTKSAMFQVAGKDLAGSGRGKRTLLWKYLERVLGEKLTPHHQTIGDCVSQGWGLGIDILDATQVVHGRGNWEGKCATEVLYAGGRVEVGKDRIPGDGMYGVWEARWCREWGVLLRKAYLDGKYDFTTYSGSKARDWAHLCKRCTPWGGGVPDELELLAKKHPVRTTALVTSWEQARDAVANGYPVAICSSVGFEYERNKDGFLHPWGIWNHCLLLAGIDDRGRQPGGLLINSWGPDWISGPTQLGQPQGSFWVTPQVIERMLSYQDSFALSAYIGYPRQNLDYHLY